MASQRTVHRDYRVEHSKVKWDPKTIEIRTHSVEKALEPLVQQVSRVSLEHVGKYMPWEDEYCKFTAKWFDIISFGFVTRRGGY